jgi:hypothetical protein
MTSWYGTHAGSGIVRDYATVERLAPHPTPDNPVL